MRRITTSIAVAGLLTFEISLRFTVDMDNLREVAESLVPYAMKVCDTTDEARMA